MLELSFRVDEKLRLVSCSPALEKLLEIPSQVPLDSPYYQWLPPIRTGSHDAVEQVVRRGESLQLADHRYGCLGGSCAVDLSIEPLTAPDRTLGAQVNISVREPLRGAAREGSEPHWDDMGKVVAMLSHGVRNPLNAIKGAVTYLQGRYAHEAELGEFADIMIEEITRLEQFISGFLSTSCQDSEPALVDINGLLQKIAVYTSLQAQAAGVSLVLECGSLPLLRIEPFQIEQAILNLLNNALAVLSVGGEIRLTSRVEQLAGRAMVAVEVVDDGPGMPRAKIEALHEPCSVPEAGRDRGFGLFIVREVIAAYGGSLEIISEMGQGTRVRLLLPVVGGGSS